MLGDFKGEDDYLPIYLDLLTKVFFGFEMKKKENTVHDVLFGAVTSIF